MNITNSIYIINLTKNNINYRLQIDRIILQYIIHRIKHYKYIANIEHHNDRTVIINSKIIILFTMDNHINSNIDMITTIDYIFYTKVIM